MALQHLRSSTAHKRPIPTVMSAGQIAINTNEASPGLFFKDSNGDLVKVGPVHIGTSAPNSSPDSVAATALVTGTVYQILTVGTSDFTLVGASANTVGTVFTATGTTTGTGTVSGQQGNEKGEQWLDTTGGAYDLKIYDGTSWRSQAGEFVNVTGDTMTGALLLDNAASASAPDLSFDGDANTGIYSPGADQVAISTGGTGRLFVDSSGRLLVGTTTEGAAAADNFTVADSGNCGVTIRSGSTSTGSVYFSDDTSGAAEYDGQISYNQTNQFMQFSTAQVERVRIDSSGRLGVATTSADGMLHIKGSGTHGSLILEAGGTSGSTNLMYLQGHNNAGTAIGEISFDETATDQGGLTFKTNGGTLTTKMTLTSAGNVGIGTTSPVGKFQVVTGGSGGNVLIDAEASSAYHAKVVNGSGDLILGSRSTSADTYVVSNRSILFKGTSSESEVARFDSSGRVGIGTTTTQHSVLAVAGTTNGPTIEMRPDNSGISDIHATYRGIGGNVPLNLRGSEIRFGSVGLATTEAARFDSSGRLLAGATSWSAGARAVVAGNSTVPTGNGVLSISRGANTAMSAGDPLANIEFTNTSAAVFARISVEADGTTGTTSDLPGRLMFWTTADSASSPTERARVNSNGSFGTLCASGVDTLYVSNGTGAGTAQLLISGRHTASSMYAGTESFRVFTNGNVQNTNNSYGAISDIKLKENIVDASSQWDDIKDLRVRNYNFIEDQTHRQIGVVAQEVETVSPGLVIESPDRDEEGNDLGTTTKSVNYSVLYMKAVKALQEAMERIETLEAKVAALEAA